MCREPVHPLTSIHSAAVYEKSLCRLLELETLPVLENLQVKQKQNKAKILKLLEEKAQLEAKLKIKKAKT